MAQALDSNLAALERAFNILAHPEHVLPIEPLHSRHHIEVSIPAQQWETVLTAQSRNPKVICWNRLSSLSQFDADSCIMMGSLFVNVEHSAVSHETIQPPPIPSPIVRLCRGSMACLRSPHFGINHFKCLFDHLVYSLRFFVQVLEFAYVFHPRPPTRCARRLQLILNGLGNKLPQRYALRRCLRLRTAEDHVWNFQSSFHRLHIPIFMGNESKTFYRDDQTRRSPITWANPHELIFTIIVK